MRRLPTSYIHVQAKQPSTTNRERFSGSSTFQSRSAAWFTHSVRNDRKGKFRNSDSLLTSCITQYVVVSSQSNAQICCIYGDTTTEQRTLVQSLFDSVCIYPDRLTAQESGAFSGPPESPPRQF